MKKNHMSFDKCIDIFEVGLGEHEGKVKYTGADLVEAMRVGIAALNFLKENIDINGNVEGRIYDEEWNYNMNEVPLGTPLKLLSRNDDFLMPQREYVGTMIHDGIFPTHGECIEGNPDHFYRSIMVAWKRLEESEDAKVS